MLFRIKGLVMPTPVRGDDAYSSDADLVPYAVGRRDLRPDDVKMDILFCGVCHLDIHHVRNYGAARKTPSCPVARSSAGGRELGMLATLAALMDFATISTDFYLPGYACHGGGARRLRRRNRMDGFLVGISLGQLF
jgi:hypothetical protein